VITKSPAFALTNKSTDWEGYSEYLENSIVLNVPLKTKEQFENDAKLLTELLQQAAKKEHARTKTTCSREKLFPGNKTTDFGQKKSTEEMAANKIPCRQKCV